MKRYRVVIRDIMEHDYIVEAENETSARAKGEDLFDLDGGCMGDYYEASARCLEEKKP